MKSQQSKEKKRVVIIGGGLSGLTAAEQLLKELPNINVTVLEAMNEVGGRTNSCKINGAKFDLGGTWIGRTQKYAQNLAERAGNQLVPQYHQGTKILDINNRVSTYQSNIPLDVGIPGLIHMQFNMWKIDRMANKLDPSNPRNSQLSFKWDSQTVRSWMDKNIYFLKVKILIQCAVRAVLGAETDEVSFLFFLWYVRQSGGINNLINIQNGLQEKKMKKGAQQLSLFLRSEIQKRKGKIVTNCYVKRVTKIQKKQNLQYHIIDQKDEAYQADFIIIAMPPARVKKIQFQPQLSRQRKYICERNIMGSIAKVLFLYEQPYWRNKGFSGQTLSDCIKTPIFNAYDDSRYKQNGQLQPAIVVFMNGAVDRQWSQNRPASEKIIVETLASYFKSEQMLSPSSIHWKVWSEQKSLNGGPIAFYPPGVLTKIDDIRAPQGRIHWAGTQMARQSQGFMDGAIQSGLRAANQIINLIKNNTQIKKKQKQQPSSNWYRKVINNSKKWIEWL